MADVRTKFKRDGPLPESSVLNGRNREPHGGGRRKLRQLEEENAPLRQVVADLSLDKEMLQEKVRRYDARSGREMTDHVRTTFGVSIRTMPAIVRHP